jgi:hypothetical protein
MKILITLLTSLFLSDSFAQLTADWTFSSNEAYNYYPTTNLLSDGDYTYVCSQSVDANNSAYIFRLNNAGVLLNSDSVQHFNYSILNDRRMVRDTSGNLYVCGEIENSAHLFKIRIIKYDSLLNRLWDIVILDTNQFHYQVKGLLYSKVDNGICIASTRSNGMDATVVIKITSDGSIRWEANDSLYPALTLIKYSIDDDGHVLLGGYSSMSGQGEDVTLIKIDTTGNYEWVYTEDGSNHSDDALLDFAIDTNGDIITINHFSDSIQFKLTKFLPNGLVQWSTPVSNIYFPKVLVSKSGIIFLTSLSDTSAAECFVARYDGNGNFVSDNFINIPNYIAYTGDYIVDFQADDSSNVYVLNNADSAGNLRWFIAKFDSSLTNIYATVYPDNINDPSTSSSLLLKDDGIIIAGSVNHFSELRVVHFSENIMLGNVTLSTNTKFSVWPNPATGLLNIFSPGNGAIKISVFDTMGKHLFENNFEENTEVKTVDISFLKPGIYFLMIKSSGQNSIVKFIRG